MQFPVHNSLLRLLHKKQNDLDNNRILRRGKHFGFNANFQQKPQRTANRVDNLDGIERIDIFTRTEKNPPRHKSRKHFALEQWLREIGRFRCERRTDAQF